MRMVKRGLLTALVFLSCIGSSAQDLLTFHASGLQDARAPLVVEGFITRSGVGEGPIIVVKNQSDRKIVGFRLEAFLRPAESCLEAPLAFGINDAFEQGAESTEVAPHGFAKSRKNLLTPNYLVHGTAKFGAAEVEVFVRVRHVKFADGSRWKAEYMSVDDVPSSRIPCRRELSSAVRRLSSTAWPLAERVETPGQEVITRLAFSCRISGEVAVCPYTRIRADYSPHE